MKNEAKANADDDRKARERADKLNEADSMLFQMDKNLKEYGDKLPADKKQPIEDAIAKLRVAHTAQDLPGIDSAMAELNTVFQAASQEMYAAAQQAQASGAQPEANTSNSKEQEVTDVDFEEVSNEKK